MIISTGYSKNKKGSCVERPAGFSYWSMAFLLKGSIELKTSMHTFTTANEAIALIPPGTAYNLAFLTNEEEIWCIFEPRPEFFTFLQPKEENTQASLIALHGSELLPEINAAMRELIRRWEQNPPHVLLAENALERVLLLAHELMAVHGPAFMDERIRKSIDYILQHYAEPITVPAIARTISMSPSRFAHLFRKQVGMAPICFLEHRRMEKARQLLLSTRLSVKEIAGQVGFVNQFHFSARFRKLTGQSPRNYRQRPQRRWQSLPAF